MDETRTITDYEAEACGTKVVIPYSVKAIKENAITSSPRSAINTTVIWNGNN